ncbi:MAG: hypothetical protein QGG53_14145 [Planctomycetota bacterium]|jgi:hypothetical protein|nr:hypothetical protein [Planctomycetota bacterium]
MLSSTHTPILSTIFLCLLTTELAFSGVVAERELLLRNTLDVERLNELVAVSLPDLDVPPELEQKIQDVKVVEESGKTLLCQLDRFGHVEGFRSEVALIVDLKPFEVRRLRFRFMDTKRNSEKPPCRVRINGNVVEVTTPAYSAKVVKSETLAVVQPKLTPKVSEDEEMEALFGEAEDPGPGIEEGPVIKSGEGGVNVPFADEGLPFAVQGAIGLGSGNLKAWGGPVRAVVTLFHPGPWRVSKVVAPCTARQSFSFPRFGKRFFFDVSMNLGEDVPRARVLFGGIRVDSVSQPWKLVMGQKGKPPRVAPVDITLNNKKRIVLEPYQKTTFSNFWAQAITRNAWVAFFIDRRTSDLGVKKKWGAGLQLMPVYHYLEDRGAYTNSVQPAGRFRTLPAGQNRRIRTVCYFGGEDDKPADGDALSRQFNATLHVPHQATEEPPSFNSERLRDLLAERNVVVVTPEVNFPDRTELWNRLAAGLGGTVRTSQGFAPYFGLMAGKPDSSILIVLVGEPGTNPLLDQFNRSHRVFDTYPLDKERRTVALFEKEGSTPVLAVVGNTIRATRSAVVDLLGRAGPDLTRPDISIAAYSWTDRMPQPWSGLRDHSGSFTAIAYPNGHADFLFLLRANCPVSGLKLKAPPGGVCRFVPWKFEADDLDTPLVKPIHDAAFSELPANLEKGTLLAIWISVPVTKAAKPGLQKHQAHLRYDGGERVIQLEAEVLSLVLPDKPSLGFYPMGGNKSELKLYYEWDDATYYQRLPVLLRQRAEFGANAYSLDVSAIRISTDAKGNPTVDASEFKKEVEAVRASGCIDLMLTNSLNHIRTHEIRKIVADEYEAWELIAPVMRTKLRELELADKLFCRHADEIADYEGWLPRARIYKRCGFKMTVAINGYGVFNKHLGVNTMGLWIPLYNFFLSRWSVPVADDDPIYFSKKFRDERHQAGEQIWPYVCGPGPYAWSTRPRSQARYLILDTYMKGADGLTYYGGMVWSHVLDPAYRKKRKARLFNIDSTFFTLFYPDYDLQGLLPTLRVCSFRFGLEDATATQVVRTLAAKKGRLESTEAEIQKSYATINMNSAQDTFNAHRRRLSELYSALKSQSRDLER